MKAKQRLLSILLALCLVLTMLPLSSLPAQAAGGMLTGSGTQESPYQIEDADDLRAFANLVNSGGGTYAWAVLTADIDLNPGYIFHEDGTSTYSGEGEAPGVQPWIPIGKADTDRYRGTFDGNGHTVSGVYVTGEQYAGVFGYVFIGTVKNLHVENSYIHAEHDGLGQAGGIAAAVGASDSSASLQNCSSSAFVSASVLWGGAGGIVGSASINANVDSCYATGSVTITSNGSDFPVAAGGVVGTLEGTLSNSYATGTVSATAINGSSNNSACAGGVVGYMEGSSSRLSNSYAIGKVSASNPNGQSYAGGVIGYQFGIGSSADNSYALSNNGTNQAIGERSGSASATNVALWSADQMKDDDFAETLNAKQRPPAWRSDNLSTQLNGGYPVLVYQTPFAESGTAEDPYLIATREELMDFRDIVNTGNDDICGRLVADIDLNPGFTFSDGSYTGSEGKQPEQWTPIGGSYAYSGTFDGDGHTISGLYINMNTTSLDDGYYGLFGYVGHGTVQDVNLTNSYLSVTSSGIYIWIGGIVGRMFVNGDGSNGTISGCTSNASVSVNSPNSSTVYAGGIVGHASTSWPNLLCIVENCGNTGNVSVSCQSYCYAGGVVGRTDSSSSDTFGTVSGCYNTGNVTATTTSVPSRPYAGGVVGYNDGELINCYNTGAVTANANGPDRATAYAGGVAGYHYGINNPVLSNSYNTGKVDAFLTDATSYVGGVVGYNRDTVTNTYYLTGTANNGIGNTTSDPSGVWSRTENEMKTSTTVDLLNGAQSPAPWQQDRAINGKQVNNGYPILFWQGVFNGGVGTQEDPYLIATKEQLEAFRDLVNNGRNNELCGKLTADIDLNPGFTFSADGSYTGSGTPEQWTPIESQNYRGSFNGDGHVIRGLYINGGTLDYAGLFGRLPSESSYIRNLGLENSYISSDSSYAGGIVGSNTGRVENCYSTAAVSSSNYYTSVGGVVGSSSGTVQNCFSTGPVSWTYQGQGEAYLGGVTGSNSGTVQNCFSTGTVSASAATAYAGAVVGQNSSNVQNCYYLEGSAQTSVGRTLGGGTVTAVESCTVEQMVGPDALTNMSLGSGWETGTALGVWTYQGMNMAADPPYSLYACTGQLPRQTVFSTHQTLSMTRTGMAMSSDRYYLIYNADQLKTFRNIVNGTLTEEEIASGYTADAAANGRLMADIVLNDNFDQTKFALGADGNVTYDGGEVPSTFEQWTPIGDYNGASVQYTGTFDGNNHTVSGVYINNSADYQGLFGRVGNGGTIQKLGVVNSYISAGEYVGGVVGRSNGAIQNCYNAGTVSAGGDDAYAGGVVGYSYASVENCYNTGSVSASGDYAEVGGVVGYNSDASVENCYNTGNISASGDDAYAGGVVGSKSSGTSVENCYNTGSVSADGSKYAYVGGVVGYSYASVKNCYNTGNISASGKYAYAGGVVGSESNGVSVENCYNTGSVSANSEGAKVGGVVGFKASNGTVQNCYFLTGTANAGIGSGYGSGAATALTVDKIEDADGLLAFLVSGVSADEENPWNSTLSAVGTWEYGKPAVQPVFTWQAVVENAPTYTVTIPATAAVNGNSETISASAGALRTDQTVEVTVAEGNSFELTNDGSDTVAYQLLAGESETPVSEGGTILSTGNTQTAASASIRFALAANAVPTYAGAYTGSCTFAVSVKQSAS